MAVKFNPVFNSSEAGEGERWALTYFWKGHVKGMEKGLLIVLAVLGSKTVMNGSKILITTALLELGIKYRSEELNIILPKRVV